MKSTEALRLLDEAGRPVLRTRDAAAVLGLSVTATSRKLRRLADDGLIGSLSHGLWSASPKPDPYVVASWLTDPLPSYVSLYTALRIHGIIQQIPRVIFVVTVARTGTVRTSAGTFSVHQIDPRLFGGFTEDKDRRIATPEKAVFDILYLERARSGRFRGLPEVELPPSFSFADLRRWANQITDARLRVHVSARVDEWVVRRSG
jgi:predicted transcriptional regulator of viral defense system